MNKLIALLLTLVLCSCAQTVFAEDLSSLTMEELTARRQELIDELNQIETKIKELEAPSQDQPLGRITDLFPDEEFAKIIRDKCAKFSIEQTVTGADLNQIDRLSLYSSTIKDFTGIGYLMNLVSFSTGPSYRGPIPEELKKCILLRNLSMEFNKTITEIPVWIADLENLEMLDFAGANISVVPDFICDLHNLKYLNVGGNELITALPENIGQLTNLKELILHDTSIEILPESIGYLQNLRELDIANTKIRVLPDSVLNLQLTTLDMSGTSIR